MELIEDIKQKCYTKIMQKQSGKYKRKLGIRHDR